MKPSILIRQAFAGMIDIAWIMLATIGLGALVPMSPPWLMVAAVCLWVYRSADVLVWLVEPNRGGK